MGRPRNRCTSGAADKTAVGRAWRAAHPSHVLRYRETARAKLQAERREAAERKAEELVRALRRHTAAPTADPKTRSTGFSLAGSR